MARIEKKLRDALGGISGILVTPFDRDDRLAPARLGPIVERAIGAGVHALVANGNTGELYVERIADAGGGLPLMLYLRNDGIGLEAVEKLCRVPGVAGVKWACPTPLRLAEAIRRCDPDIVWVDGLAEPWAPPFFAVGARGFTSGLINVWPEHSMAIHAALEKGDYAAARKLIDVMAGFEELRAEEQNGTNVTVVKAALQLLGEDCGATRPPSAWPLTEHQVTKLKKQLDSWGLGAGRAVKEVA